LAQRAEEARNAVASLTQSVTQKTKSRFNAFLPAPKSIGVALPPLREFDEPLDPAALKQAGMNVAHSFDPIAQTTVQAFGFFAREMPVFEFPKN
jgi:hypothetical protein